ncbi:MAG: hypothetical protein SWY16_11715 [Cyanobacteriota bacterium]|nr:hypothetical protein [Cyanobacteriota bacterium]
MTDTRDNLKALAEQIDWPFVSQDFALIDRLDRKSLGDVWFEADIPFNLSMPHFFVPFGSTPTSETVGLYLHPRAMARQKLPVISLAEEGQLIEVAPSLPIYLHYLLTNMEAYAVEDGDDPMESMAEELDWIGEILGGDFYAIGQHGDDPDVFNTDTVDRYIIDTFGGSARNFIRTPGWRKQPTTDTIAHLERGIAANPSSLALHARLAIYYHKNGRLEAALQSITSALKCYRHTEGWNDLKNLRQLVLDLSHSGYAIGDRQVIRELMEDNADKRVEQIVSLYREEAFEPCAKLLDDLCYEVCTYDYRPIHELLQEIYRRLGWNWLQPFMSQRKLFEADDLARDFARKNLQADWDAPLRA